MASRGWVYRVQERLAFGHGRWHLRVCPLCRRAARGAREEEKVP